MSTQLILYPQNYNSYSFNNVQLLNEYASNITFVTPAISTTGMSAGGLDWAVSLSGSVPAQFGNWRLFYTDSTTAIFNATTIPTISTSANTLTLYSSSGSGSNGSLAGAYQKLSGLSIGGQYTLTIEHNSLPSGSEFQIGWQGAGIFIFNDFVVGTVGNTFTAINNSGNTVTTFDFTAQVVDPIISIAYKNTTNETINISKISVTENPSTIPQTPIDLSDGQVICDLYQEEDIPLTLSIDNFKNAAEKTQSYSKDFDLPATKRNNKIFTHIFDVQKTINNVFDFNPYLRTKAVLKQDGLLVFEGQLRLIEIKDNNGEISYNVNLFAETIALKDVLEGRTFSQLNLEELNHNYNYNNIVNSWEGQLQLVSNLSSDSFALVSGLPTNETNVLKYPFVDWTGNINCTGSEPELKRLEDAFRPFIQCKYLLDNIARDAGYTFVSEFFDSTEFSKLYIDFNWGATEGPATWSDHGSTFYRFNDPDYYAGTTSTVWQFEHNGSLLGYSDFGANSGWDLATNKFTCPQQNTYYKLGIRCWIDNTNAGGSNTLNYLRIVRNNVSGTFGAAGTKDYWDIAPPNTSLSGTVGSNNHLFTFTNLSTPGIPLGLNDELYIEWEAADASVLKQFNDDPDLLSNSSIAGTVYNNATAVTSGNFNTKRGQTKQWEFLKGLMTMFNLISMPDPKNANNIIFEPYADMFVSDTSGTTLSERSIKHDWTDKIDISKIDLKPMELNRMVKFKYVHDEEDYALHTYKIASNGFEYGTKELNGSTAIVGSNQITNLVGLEEIVAQPFAPTIIKPIQDIFPNFIIPVIYGSQGNNTFDSIDNAPRILYNNGRVNGNHDVPGQNGVPGGVKPDYLQFSHFNPSVPADNTSYDYNFGSCQLFPGVAPASQPVNNLYNIYHAPYYNELYDVNTRIMTCKVYLNAADINTFDFRDKVMIKNKVYRVNKIDYKPNALSTVEFILIP